MNINIAQMPQVRGKKTEYLCLYDLENSKKLGSFEIERYYSSKTCWQVTKVEVNHNLVMVTSNSKDSIKVEVLDARTLGLLHEDVAPVSRATILLQAVFLSRGAKRNVIGRHATSRFTKTEKKKL